MTQNTLKHLAQRYKIWRLEQIERDILVQESNLRAWRKEAEVLRVELVSEGALRVTNNRLQADGG